MDAITITFDHNRYFIVGQGDLACDGLCWDEMIGQIINLTRRVVGERIYPMLTAGERREREYRYVNPEESPCDEWPVYHTGYDPIPF